MVFARLLFTYTVAIRTVDDFSFFLSLRLRRCLRCSQCVCVSMAANSRRCSRAYLLTNEKHRMIFSSVCHVRVFLSCHSFLPLGLDSCRRRAQSARKNTPRQFHINHIRSITRVPRWQSNKRGREGESRIDRSKPKRCVSIEQRFLADFFVVDVSSSLVNHHGKCVASLECQSIRNDGQNGRTMSSIEKIT